MSDANRSSTSTRPVSRQPRTHLRHLRQFHDLTQEQLGDRVGADNSIVSKWERGRLTPKPEVQRAVAEVLGVDVRLIFPEEDGVNV